MNHLVDANRAVLYELETVRPNLHAVREQDRRAWWMAAASASGDASESLIRRMVVRLGDLFVDLGCLLQARYAPEPHAAAC